LVGLVVVELRVAEPMLDLRLFSERMFRNANIITSLNICGLIGVLFLLPQFLQDPDVRNLTALQSGLTTFAQAVGMMVAIRFVSRLYAKVGPRRLVIGGLLVVTANAVMFQFIGATTNLWWIRLLMFVRGVAMSFAFIPMQAATYANISKADTGRASALYSTQRQVGSAFGVAILATVWISRTKALVSHASGSAAIRQAKVAGFHQAFLIAAVLSLLAALSALMIKDRDAAASLPSTFFDSSTEDSVDDVLIPAVIAGV
jgi:MFS family permease